MIYCEEVNENLYNNIPDRFDRLSTHIQNYLKNHKCNKCGGNLPPNGDIHYVVLSKKVMWWHDHCVTYTRKK